MSENSVDENISDMIEAIMNYMEAVSEDNAELRTMYFRAGCLFLYSCLPDVYNEMDIDMIGEMCKVNLIGLMHDDADV